MSSFVTRGSVSFQIYNTEKMRVHVSHHHDVTLSRLAHINYNLLSVEGRVPSTLSVVPDNALLSPPPVVSPLRIFNATPCIPLFPVSTPLLRKLRDVVTCHIFRPLEHPAHSHLQNGRSVLRRVPVVTSIVIIGGGDARELRWQWCIFLQTPRVLMESSWTVSQRTWLFIIQYYYDIASARDNECGGTVWFIPCDIM